MGLTKSDAVVLALIMQHENVNIENILCIGAPETHFTPEWLQHQLFPWMQENFPKINQNQPVINFAESEYRKSVPFRDFFGIWGKKIISVMDVDDYEGADIVFDLNLRDFPNDLKARFDLIVDGGSLEHCFNISSALNSMSEMLAENGVIFHSNPANQMLDHGFYQISPTLYPDYYNTIGFDLLFGGLSHIATNFIWDVKIQKYKKDIYRSNNGHKYTSKLPTLFVIFAAQKRSNWSPTITVVQNYYQKIHTKTAVDFSTDIKYQLSNIDIKIRRNLLLSFKNLFKLLFRLSE